MSSPSFEVDPFYATIMQLRESRPDSPAIVGPFRTKGYVRDDRIFFGAELAVPEDATPWLGAIVWQPEPPLVQGMYWRHDLRPAHGLMVTAGSTGEEFLIQETPPIRGIHFTSTEAIGWIDVGNPVFDANGWSFEPVEIQDVNPQVMPIVAAQMDQFVDDHILHHL